MTLRVRALSEEEEPRLARLTRSQKLGAGLVRRAQIIQHAVDGLSAPGIAAKMGLCGATVRFWLKRFNERGLSGLEEEMRSGRPPTYTAEERSAVIAAALSRPAELGPGLRAADRRFSVLPHGTTNDPGVRGHAVVAEGVRLRGRLDGVRAKPDAVGLLRSADGEQSMKFGSVRPIVWPTPEFATSPRNDPRRREEGSAQQGRRGLC